MKRRELLLGSASEIAFVLAVLPGTHRPAEAASKALKDLECQLRTLFVPGSFCISGVCDVKELGERLPRLLEEALETAAEDEPSIAASVDEALTELLEGPVCNRTDLAGRAT